jgi:hypothetical protein
MTTPAPDAVLVPAGNVTVPLNVTLPSLFVVQVLVTASRLPRV